MSADAVIRICPFCLDAPVAAGADRCADCVALLPDAPALGLPEAPAERDRILGQHPTGALILDVD